MAGLAAAGDGLGDLARVRATVRRDRQDWGWTAVLLGAVSLGAAPLYVQPALPAGPAVDAWVVSPNLLGMVPILRTDGWWGLYWPVALTAVGVAVVARHRVRARRRGVDGPLWPPLATMAGLVALVVVWSPALVQRLLPPLAPLYTLTEVLWLRGMMPLLVIAIGLLVLAATQHSRGLTVTAAVYLALALLANLYDLANLVPGGLGRFGLVLNLALPSVFLLLSGLAAVRRQALP